MTARLAVGAGGLAALVLLSLGIAVEGGRKGTGATDRAAGSAAAGFEIVMRGVDARELREGPDGELRLRAGTAEFHPSARVLTARQLELAVPGRTGPIAVEAPEGIWTMNDARLVLSGGAVARWNGRWSAATSAADIDLGGRVLAATGPAEVRGPGLTVEGRNLVWRWREGNVRLDAPRSRIDPVRLPMRRKEG